MVEYHWLDGQYHRLPSLVDDLIRRRVDVIATPAFLAAGCFVATSTLTGIGGCARPLVATVRQPAPDRRPGAPG
jgi:hypothetical protein